MIEYAIDFYVFSYFGKKYEELSKDKSLAVYTCAYRAYLDLNRTMNFIVEDKDKEIYRLVVSETIKTKIMNYIKMQPKEDFNDWHKKVCCIDEDSIVKKSKGFVSNMSYGKAQKWLNMTIKYMMILGFWEELNLGGDVHSLLHVPVDRFVINAVWEMNDVQLPVKSGSKREKQYVHPCDHVEAWSTWNCTQYENFQQTLRDELKKRNQVPIDWEGAQWIEQAVLESSRYLNK